jgi:predicted HNH restriction endonuclease
MEIKDLIKCENNDILPIQSKMIANLLLSGTPYQIYQYKCVSEDIEKKYNTYIRYNMRFDPNIKIKGNVAPLDVGKYAGKISELCTKLELPLISVKINSAKDMPHEGFFVFPQCQKMRKQGFNNTEIAKKIKQEVTEAFESGAYNKLIDYLNGTLNTTDDSLKQSNSTKNTSQIADIKHNQTDYNEKEFYEGRIKEISILQRERNQEIVKYAKQRDNYTCKVCGFSYNQKVVQVHHVIPLSKQNEEYEIKIDDLITLCPTCHSLAHLLLDENEIYVNKSVLINKLKELRSQV